MRDLSIKLKVGDAVCIGNCQALDENDLYYGLHAIVTEVDTRSAAVDFHKWSEITGAQQEVPKTDVKKWFPVSILWKDSGIKRFVFEPNSEPFLTKDERRALVRQREEARRDEIRKAGK